MFEILGFFFIFLLLGFLSLTFLFCVRFGGLDLSPISGKALIFAIPVMIALCLSWYALFSNSPFSLTVG